MNQAEKSKHKNWTKKRDKNISRKPFLPIPLFQSTPHINLDKVLEAKHLA